jgi:Mrp family chromosome partitioning ATPase
LDSISVTEDTVIRAPAVPTANAEVPSSSVVQIFEPPRGWVGLNWSELWRYRELLYFLTWRDVKVRYKQTVLGAAWAILRADVTIFDTPPCLPATDPVIVAARMDGVVLVLQANQTRKGSVRQTLELLDRARAHLIGVLFNQTQQRDGYYYQDYHYGSNDVDAAAQHWERHRNGKRPEQKPQTRKPPIDSSRAMSGDPGA